MKKIASLLLVFLVVTVGFTQTDTALTNRLSEYIRWNKELNFKRLMDYIHPSLFKLAPREQLVEVFEKIYDNEEMKITMERLESRAISEPFMLEGVQYQKVDYYLVMHMKYKDESKTADTSFTNNMVVSLRNALPQKKIIFDPPGKNFIIQGMDVLIAIKDNPTASWLFLGYDGNNEMIRNLFPKELIEHFKLQ